MQFWGEWPCRLQNHCRLGNCGMPSLEHRMYSNRLDSHSTKDSNAAQLPALVPLEVVLARHNLDQYTEVFEQAGFKLYDIAKHMSDMEVEACESPHPTEPTKPPKNKDTQK
eukprot:1445906-Amphidinium_carterae.1